MAQPGVTQGVDDVKSLKDDVKVGHACLKGYLFNVINTVITEDKLRGTGSSATVLGSDAKAMVARLAEYLNTGYDATSKDGFFQDTSRKYLLEGGRRRSASKKASKKAPKAAKKASKKRTKRSSKK